MKATKEPRISKEVIKVHYVEPITHKKGGGI